VPDLRHVGCCDESKNKHATKHFHATKHPIITSLEPGEGWSWCYVDEVADGAEVMSPRAAMAEPASPTLEARRAQTFRSLAPEEIARLRRSARRAACGRDADL